MPTGRVFPPSFVLGRHLYAVGGMLSGEARGYTIVNSVERYDTETDSWSPVADMNTTRVFASSIVLGEADDGGEVDLFESLIAKATRARS